jgi:pyridoxal phosphate enzyme (YggS family)
VRLVAVTKTVPPTVAQLLPSLGIVDLGESRPQELWRKRAALPEGARWHLIGHLQRNKVERTLPVYLLHSVDSLRLIEAIGEAGKRRGFTAPVLLETNLTGERSKLGFPPSALAEALDHACTLGVIQPIGLMTMAEQTTAPEKARPTFARLADLLGHLNEQGKGRWSLTELSMGMSQDFEVAIEEGATMIRLGSVLFDGLYTLT